MFVVGHDMKMELGITPRLSEQFAIGQQLAGYAAPPESVADSQIGDIDIAIGLGTVVGDAYADFNGTDDPCLAAIVVQCDRANLLLGFVASGCCPTSPEAMAQILSNAEFE